MRSKAMTGRMVSRLACVATLLAWAGLATTAAPAAAQRYTNGYDFIPNPPVSSRPTTFVLYGNFPTGCGVVEEASVIDPDHVAIRLRSTTCPDSGFSWAQSFSLGMLAAGNHTLSITLTMDRPDSGVTVHEGTLTYGVEDTTVAPPPPPPPLPGPPLVANSTTDPWPPTPDVPIAFILNGYAPFDCPVVSAAAVVDTSHLALTLSRSACNDTTRFWTHRFELGIQREGHHFMDLAITLEGDSVTHHVPVGFLVVLDPTGWLPPPPDSLNNVLSPSRPNPFSAESKFSVSLDDGVQADVAVFDINGRRVTTVFRGRIERGTTELAWNGRRDDGSRAVPGIYFYRLSIPGRVMSRRIVLLRQQ